MAYTNSSLVTYKRLTNNRTSPRNHAIDTITIHCIVGQWTAKQGCDYFATTDRQCSANYVVGKDGSIGLSVEEKDRSWCSSNAANDNRAITIEVASDTSHPYAVTDKAYEALIKLVADICKRNGIKKLLWKADKSLVGQVDKQNMTVHRWFANKACPGDYLYNRHGEIAEKVNAILGGSSTGEDKETPVTTATLYRVRKTWADAKSQKGAFKNLSLAKACADKNPGYSVFDENGKVVYSNSVSQTEDGVFTPYKVKVTDFALNIRKGAGTNYAVSGVIRDKGVYTIVDEANGTGATKWGKLKSGAGWISLNYTKRLV